MKILVTGGAGFIGSNFIRFLLGREHEGKYQVINLDKLTYAGNPENLAGLAAGDAYRFVHGDICDGNLVDEILKTGVDAVINFAAESHVDRSIHDPDIFLKTNIMGVQCLLQAARRNGVKRFLQVSTDEVYGSLSLEAPAFREDFPLAPNSPYSASKAAADLLVRSYFKTYGMPVVMTRCSNNYGPYQFPEKLIPLLISNALDDQPLPIYGDGLYVRDWVHVLDHCRALLLALENGKAGEIYNIGGEGERNNLYITHEVLRILGKPASLIRYVADRPGHDRRYAIDFSKAKRELGWQPSTPLSEGLLQTVRWYQANEEWWRRIKSGAYREFYEKQYGDRLQ
ncbi:MAG TPA: dTDP-glucose 4,6-dehydratase [Thermodesulfobacteriota bacterium]|nr:dTDP-glucose 4,6-dehydratase [Thermodesulfobacteriota bacterium]